MAKRGKNQKVKQEDKAKMELTTKTPPPVPVPPVQNQALRNMGLGRSAQDAIDLQNESDITLAVSKHLDKMFFVPKDDKTLPNPGDGDYFIISEQIAESMDRTKKFKVVYVEDSKGKKHQIFFLLPRTRI